MREARAGDTVLLVSDQGRRRYIRTLEPGRRIETDRGVFAHDDLIGSPIGSQVQTHLGHTYFLLLPTTDEIVKSLPRESQIIFPKDAGYIMMKMGVAPGARVIEAGTGSGGLCLALASAVGDNGHVYSYDIRSDMQVLARRNLERAGLDKRVTLKRQDAQMGFDEEDVDALFLDLLVPNAILGQARAALRGGGVLGCLVPTANQVIDLLNGFAATSDYAFVEVEELILRSYKPVPARFRPEDHMIGHTGYLVFARAVTRSSRAEPQPPLADSETLPEGQEEES